MPPEVCHDVVTVLSRHLSRVVTINNPRPDITRRPIETGTEMSSGECPGVEIGNLAGAWEGGNSPITQHSCPLLSRMFTQMAGVANTIHSDSSRALGGVAWS